MLPSINLGGTHVSTFIIVMIVAYGVAFLWGVRRGVDAGLDRQDVFDGVIIGCITAVFGAKLGHLVFESAGHRLPDGSVSTGMVDLLRADPWHWARIEDPGYVWYGGALAMVPVALWFTRSRGLDRYVVADAGAPLLGFVVGFGRLGCFLGGCCYGVPTDVPWGITFPAASGAGPHAVHPTQLYESAFGFALLAFLHWYEPRRKVRGELLAIGAVGYAAARFTIEFWRGDAERGVHAGWGTSQIVSVPVFLIALGVWAWLRKNAPRVNA
ncbi:MAG: prolipoprotein diacylglyceryl transferase [Deltaproteobacteria bacterium]|nr:prolipoprotein diacylglyceryl transferase [Deltaproteobacteria bacterium]